MASLSSAPRPSGSQFRSWSLVVIGGPHCIDGHRWSSLVRSVYHHHVCSGKIVSSCRAQEERGLKPRSSHNLSTLRVILSTGGDLIIFILILVLLFTKAVFILESFRQTINVTLGLPTVIFLLTTNSQLQIYFSQGPHLRQGAMTMYIGYFFLFLRHFDLNSDSKDKLNFS